MRAIEPERAARPRSGPAPAAAPPLGTCPPPSALAAQRQALVDLYENAGGPAWKNASGWAGAGPECGWAGVVCGACGEVLQLQLDGNNMIGTLPLSLASLTSLQVLDVQYNALSGTLDGSLAALSQLSSLRFDVTGVSGTLVRRRSPRVLTPRLRLTWPACSLSVAQSLAFTAWTRLEWLVAGPSSISGTLAPELLQAWPRLLELELEATALSGTLPDEFSHCTALRKLRVSDTGLWGTLPASLAALTTLEYLTVGTTRISGTVSGARWSRLLELEMGNTLISGTLDAAWGGWTQVLDLRLGPSLLSGTIPPAWAACSTLLSLSVQRCRISGTIAPAQATWTRLRIFLADYTLLSGTLASELAAWTSVTMLSLENTLVSGSLHADFARWHAIMGLCTFALPTASAHTCSLARPRRAWRCRADLLSSPVSGTLDPSFSNWTRLSLLRVSNTLLSGTLSTDFVAWKGLYTLDAAGTLLSGTLSPVLAGWSDMQSVRLHRHARLICPHSVTVREHAQHRAQRHNRRCVQQLEQAAAVRPARHRCLGHAAHRPVHGLAVAGDPVAGQHGHRGHRSGLC